MSGFSWRDALVGALGCSFLASLAPTVAFADVFDGEFTVGSTLPNNTSPGYGTVTVTTVGSDLKFDIELTNGAYLLADTGSHYAVTFDLAMAGLQISSTPSTFNALPTPFSVPTGTSFTQPGFGSFDYAIACSGGGNGINSCDGTSSLVFYVLGGAGQSPVLTDGIYATVDMGIVATGATGVVGATAVPGPIVGAGLPGIMAGAMALVAMARRRRSQRFAK